MYDITRIERVRQIASHVVGQLFEADDLLSTEIAQEASQSRIERLCAVRSELERCIRCIKDVVRPSM